MSDRALKAAAAGWDLGSRVPGGGFEARLSAACEAYAAVELAELRLEHARALDVAQASAGVELADSQERLEHMRRLHRGEVALSERLANELAALKAKHEALATAARGLLQSVYVGNGNVVCPPAMHPHIKAIVEAMSAEPQQAPAAPAVELPTRDWLVEQLDAIVMGRNLARHELGGPLADLVAGILAEAKRPAQPAGVELSKRGEKRLAGSVRRLIATWREWDDLEEDERRMVADICQQLEGAVAVSESLEWPATTAPHVPSDDGVRKEEWRWHKELDHVTRCLGEQRERAEKAERLLAECTDSHAAATKMINEHDEEFAEAETERDTLQARVYELEENLTDDAGNGWEEYSKRLSIAVGERDQLRLDLASEKKRADKAEDKTVKANCERDTALERLVRANELLTEVRCAARAGGWDPEAGDVSLDKYVGMLVDDRDQLRRDLEACRKSYREQSAVWESLYVRDGVAQLRLDLEAAKAELKRELETSYRPRTYRERAESAERRTEHARAELEATERAARENWERAEAAEARLKALRERADEQGFLFEMEEVLGRMAEPAQLAESESAKQPAKSEPACRTKCRMRSNFRMR